MACRRAGLQAAQTARTHTRVRTHTCRGSCCPCCRAAVCAGCAGGAWVHGAPPAGSRHSLPSPCRGPSTGLQGGGEGAPVSGGSAATARHAEISPSLLLACRQGARTGMQLGQDLPARAAGAGRVVGHGGGFTACRDSSAWGMQAACKLVLQPGRSTHLMSPRSSSSSGCDILQRCRQAGRRASWSSRGPGGRQRQRPAPRVAAMPAVWRAAAAAAVLGAACAGVATQQGAGRHWHFGPTWRTWLLLLVLRTVR